MRRLLVLLAWQALWFPAAHAQQPGKSALDEQLSTQERIYRSRGEDVPGGYVLNRSLLAYAHSLSAEFDRSLANLGSEDRWLDIGAGEGRAVLDYYTPRYDAMHPEGRKRRGKKARAVAISIEDRRSPLWQQTAAILEANHIQYLHGRRLREYSPEELGRFQLITDVMGGFSYSLNLSLFMENVLALLDLNGSFFTVLQNVRVEAATIPPDSGGAALQTDIANAEGTPVKVCSWLKSIGCAEVTCELRSDANPLLEAYHVRKICDDVAVPALEAVQFVAGTPPARRFRLKRPPAGAAGAARD